MSRKREFRDREFIERYNAAPSVSAVADHFNISLVATYQHANRLGLKSPKRKQLKQLRRRILHLYRGKRSLLRVAKKLRLSEGTIRFHLIRSIGSRWRPTRAEPEVLPRPRKLTELKIVHALDDGIPLVKEALAKHTKLSPATIESYLGRINGHARTKS